MIDFGGRESNPTSTPLPGCVSITPSPDYIIAYIRTPLSNLLSSAYPTSVKVESVSTEPRDPTRYNSFRSRLLERITTDPDVRFGKPCIRGHRITVQEILEWLSSGASQQQILADYPQLEPEDFLAVYAYAAELAAERKVSGG